MGQDMAGCVWKEEVCGRERREERGGGRKNEERGRREGDEVAVKPWDGERGQSDIKLGGFVRDNTEVEKLVLNEKREVEERGASRCNGLQNVILLESATST